MPDFILARIRVMGQEVGCRHDHAWRTEPTLQTVFFLKTFLEGMQGAVCRHALNGGYRSTIGLDGEQGTGFNGCAINMNGASTALTGIASNVRSCQVKVIPKKINEKCSRVHGSFLHNTIDRD